MRWEYLRMDLEFGVYNGVLYGVTAENSMTTNHQLLKLLARYFLLSQLYSLSVKVNGLVCGRILTFNISKQREILPNFDTFNKL